MPHHPVSLGKFCRKVSFDCLSCRPNTSVLCRGDGFILQANLACDLREKEKRTGFGFSRASESDNSGVTWGISGVFPGLLLRIGKR
jgi:hypothetical protein